MNNIHVCNDSIQGKKDMKLKQTVHSLSSELILETPLVKMKIKRHEMQNQDEAQRHWGATLLLPPSPPWQKIYKRVSKYLVAWQNNMNLIISGHCDRQEAFVVTAGSQSI